MGQEGVEGGARKSFAYSTISPGAGPADWFPPEGKAKVTKREKVCCVERFKLTEEKEAASGVGMPAQKAASGEGLGPCGYSTPSRWVGSEGDGWVYLSQQSTLWRSQAGGTGWWAPGTFAHRLIPPSLQEAKLYREAEPQSQSSVHPEPPPCQPNLVIS